MRKGILTSLFAVTVLGILTLLYIWRGGSSVLFLLVLSSFIVVQGVIMLLSGPRHVTVTRSWSPLVPSAGDEVQVTLTIRTIGGLPPLWLEVSDTMGGWLRFAGYKKEFTGTYTLNNVSRGIYSDCNINVQWGDPFGWFKKAITVPGKEKLVVHPTPLKLNISKQNVHDTNGDTTEVVVAGRDVFQAGGRIRNYETGDPLRSIHWKSSAKRGLLLTAISEEAMVGQRWLLLITGKEYYNELNKNEPNKNEPNKAFEIAVSGAAAWMKSELTDEMEHVSYCQSGMMAPIQLSGIRGVYEGLNILADVQVTESVSGGDVASLLQLPMKSISRLPSSVTVITGELTTEIVECLLQLIAKGCIAEVWTSGALHETGTEHQNHRHQQREHMNRLQQRGIVIHQLNAQVNALDEVPSMVSKGGTVDVGA